MQAYAYKYLGLICLVSSKGLNERPTLLMWPVLLSSIDEGESNLHLPASYYPPIAFLPPLLKQSPLPVSIASTRAWGHCTSSCSTLEQGADDVQSVSLLNMMLALHKTDGIESSVKITMS